MRNRIQVADFVHASIRLPASKSISNRSLVLNALSNSHYAIENLSNCDDTAVMIKAFHSKESWVDIKAAGTAMRFLTAYFSQQEGEWIITGTERMKKRPVKVLVDALILLGADIEYLENTGFPPLKMTGKKLQGGSISLDGGVSSQYISALLMIAPLMEEGLNLKLEGEIISAPYLEMTICMMEDFGVKVDRKEQEIRVEPQTYLPVPYQVESDWSAASYWYEIIALGWQGAEVELLGLHKNSIQGDSAIADLSQQLGVRTEFTGKGVKLSQSGVVVSDFNYNFVNIPDLAQTFAVTCALKNIHFSLSGLQSLKIKETDRISALQNELKKLGYLVENKDDNCLQWYGERCEPKNPMHIDTYEDHRMAMAFAPAALKLGKININESSVVSKSYPSYWEDLQKVGFVIDTIT